MIGREKRVLLRHYLEQGMSKAAIARHLGISRRTVYNWIEAGELDRDADSRAVRYGPQPQRSSKLDPYKGIIDARLAAYPKLSAVRLFNEVRAAGYPGSYGQVKRYVLGVRPKSRRNRSGGSRRLRPPGPGGFRGLPAAVGQAARADRGAGLLAADVAQVLRASDDAGRDARAGGVVRLLRRRAVGTAVRPDEGRHHRRPARGRWTTGREPGVPALQLPLAFPDPGVPSVPGPDEGQGRAVHPLHSGQLLLRPGLRLRRRPERADAAVARRRGQHSSPWDAEGARDRPVRTGEAQPGSPGALPYRSVVPHPQPPTARAGTPLPTPVVRVERRPLSEYAGLAGELS